MITAFAGPIRKAGLSGLFCASLLGLALTAATNVPGHAQALLLEVRDAHPGYDQRTKEPIVTYRLLESSKRLLADFTSKNVGQPIELRVDGRVLMKVVIREPILGGQGQLSGGLTLEQADSI